MSEPNNTGMYVFTWNFWKDAVSRSIRTFCQTLVSVLGVSELNVFSASWGAALGISLGSCFVSFLMCLDRAFAITEVKVIAVENYTDRDIVEARPL